MGNIIIPVLLSLSLLSFSSAYELNVGVNLFENDDYFVRAPAIQLLMDYWTNNKTLFPNHNVTIKPVFAPSCKSVDIDMADCMKKSTALADTNVAIVVGEALNAPVYGELQSSIYSTLNIPYVNNGAGNSLEFERTTKHGSSVVISSPYNFVSYLRYMDWLKSNNFKRFAIISPSEDVCSAQTTLLRQAASEQGISIAETFIVPSYTGVRNASNPAWTKIAASEETIFYFCASVPTYTVTILYNLIDIGFIAKNKIIFGLPTISAQSMTPIQNYALARGLNLTNSPIFYTGAVYTGIMVAQQYSLSQEYLDMESLRAAYNMSDVNVRANNFFALIRDHIYAILYGVSQAVNVYNVDIERIIDRSWANPKSPYYANLVNNRGNFFTQPSTSLNWWYYPLIYTSTGVSNINAAIYQVNVAELQAGSSYNNQVHAMIANNGTVTKLKAGIWDQQGSQSIPRLYALTYTTPVFDNPSFIAGLVVLIVLEVFTLLIAVFMYFNRENRHIKGGAVNFMFIILLGIALSYVAFFLEFFEATKGRCTASDVVYHIAFSITFASLLIKTWRVSKIFNSKNFAKVNKQVSDSRLFTVFFAQLLIVVVYLIIWKVVNPYEIAVQNNSVTASYGVQDTEQLFSCAYTQWDIGISVVELFVMSAGAWLAYQTSKVPNEYNESNFLALAVYNTFIISILTFFIRQNSTMTAHLSAILQMICVLLIFFPIQILLFVPKLLYAQGILTPREVIVLSSAAAGKTRSSNNQEESNATDRRGSAGETRKGSIRP